MARPVITFLTDFGADSAAAICRGVILGIARDAQIVDISHAVRKYAVRDGAYLLWSALPWMPVGVHVAIVDPGVGTERLPIGIRAGRGDILVGPDNGLLVAAAERLGGIVEVRVLEAPDLMLPLPGSTFHGRDVFAPIAAHLATGVPFERVGRVLADEELQRFEVAASVVRDGGLDTSISYIDSFGNARLAADPGELVAAVGSLGPGRTFRVEIDGAGSSPPAAHLVAGWHRTFGGVEPGEALLYEDSSGRLALADNQGDIAARLVLESGQAVRIEPA